MTATLIDVAPVPVIITGMPGAGKSTITEGLCRQLPRAARVNGDTVAAMILGGRVWALGEPADEAAQQVELTNRNLVLLANSFVAAGFTAAIEGVIPDRRQLDAIADALDVQPLLVVLAPGIDSCRDRNATRSEQERWEFTGYEGLEAEMAEGFGDRGWWLDTSRMTADETIDLIIAEAPARARIR